MKTSFTACLSLLMFVAILRAEPSLSLVPVDGADVAAMLGLPVTKTLIKFDGPKKVILRFSTPGGEQHFLLPGTSASVTLLTYVPDGAAATRILKFWLTGSGGSVHGGCSYDDANTNFMESRFINGVFTVRGGPTQDFSKTTYTIQVLASN